MYVPFCNSFKTCMLFFCILYIVAIVACAFFVCFQFVYVRNVRKINFYRLTILNVVVRFSRFLICCRLAIGWHMILNAFFPRWFYTLSAFVLRAPAAQWTNWKRWQLTAINKTGSRIVVFWQIWPTCFTLLYLQQHKVCFNCHLYFSN